MNRDPAPGRLGVLTQESLADLEEMVRQRLGGRLRDFRLLIRDAGLVMRGRTRTRHAKQLAQHALIEMTDAPINANEIEVCDAPSPAQCDAALAVHATLITRMPPGSPRGDSTL
jgi:hypothetical protein